MQTMVQAKQFLSNPSQDPLFFENDRVEEHKTMRSPYTATSRVMLDNSKTPIISEPSFHNHVSNMQEQANM